MGSFSKINKRNRERKGESGDSQVVSAEGHPVLAFPGLPFPAGGINSGTHFAPERDGMARKATPGLMLKFSS